MKSETQISSEENNKRVVFYYYTGFHSLLIGLFPFYIPVFLWNWGYSLSEISYFIAGTGFGFCLTLWLWDRISKQVGLKSIIRISFLIEAALLSAVFFSGFSWFLFLFSLLNGAYNCFFWIVQRVLFYEMVSPDNSGRNFGNFQIFVVILLKVGVFTGGIILERQGFFSLYLLSIFVAFLGALSLQFFLQHNLMLPATLINKKPYSLNKLIRFQDGLRSKLIFSLDGVFLYLESYFWLLSLFLIVQENFWHLGLLIILLTIAFSMLFFFIKNSIDRTAKQKIYTLAVLFYIGSWILRGSVGEGMASPLLFTLLVLITFCTSFFRLAFNKRFFDHAKGSSGYEYILAKSYYSQFFIGVIFMALGLIYSHWQEVSQNLAYSYMIASGAAILYLRYPLRER